MKRILTAVFAIVFALSAFAQDQSVMNSTIYVTRYNLLVSKVGDSGIGVSGFLDKWEAADSTDINMMLGRFNYFLSRSAKDTVIQKSVKSYLGNKPVLSLKDSTGKVSNFFKDTNYDDADFAQALKWIEKAIAADNTKMELFVAKSNALVRYEKETPDMAAHYLCEVIDKNFTNKSKWTYYQEAMTPEIFDALIQDYCFSFYKIGSPSSYEAFRKLSEKMLKYEPKCLLFLDNLGSYYLVVKKNYSKAKSYYSKALKIDPNDATAKTNMEILLKTSAQKKK